MIGRYIVVVGQRLLVALDGDGVIFALEPPTKKCFQKNFKFLEAQVLVDNNNQSSVNIALVNFPPSSFFSKITYIPFFHPSQIHKCKSLELEITRLSFEKRVNPKNYSM